MTNGFNPCSKLGSTKNSSSTLTDTSVAFVEIYLNLLRETEVYKYLQEKMEKFTAVKPRSRRSYDEGD